MRTEIGADGTGPFQLGPKQVFSCRVSFEPGERDRLWFRSKGKLYFSVAKRRGERSHCRVGTPPDRPCGGLLSRESPQRRGGEATQGPALGALRTLPAQRLCTRPAPTAILNCSGACSGSAEVLGTAISHREFWSEGSGARVLRATPSEQVQLDQA